MTGPSGVTGATGSTRRHRLGRGLVDVPPVPARDPATAIMAEPHVPEQRRFCGKCNEPVGRSRDGAAGPRPRASAATAATVLVRRQAVRRATWWPASTRWRAAWPMAASAGSTSPCDRKVADRWVVLKGLIDTGDEDAVAAALAERRFLAEVEHPNIVKIHNFVEHDGDGYIVMEYVNGYSLRSAARGARAAAGDRPIRSRSTRPSPTRSRSCPRSDTCTTSVSSSATSSRTTSSAHAESVKLIDLGGVYRMDDADQPDLRHPGLPGARDRRTGPTVASDLFTVAGPSWCCARDFRGYRGTYQYTLPLAETSRSSSSTTRSTGSSSGPRPLIPRPGSQSADEMAGATRGCAARDRGVEVARDTDRGPAPASPGRADGPRRPLAGAACRCPSSVPTIEKLRSW